MLSVTINISGRAGDDRLRGRTLEDPTDCGDRQRSGSEETARDDSLGPHIGLAPFVVGALREQKALLVITGFGGLQTHGSSRRSIARRGSYGLIHHRLTSRAHGPMAAGSATASRLRSRVRGSETVGLALWCWSSLALP
jgi:hypothetical protein